MSQVSVAIASYNGVKYIRSQIESILAQTKPPYEIVVCDDGSDDGTVEIVQDISEDSEVPIRLYKNETRLGFRANFLKAAMLCRSEIICFCDQDDYWYPNKLLVVTSYFSDDRVSLVIHDADVIDVAGNVIGRMHNLSRGSTYVDRLGASPWAIHYGFTMVFRANLLKHIPHESSVDPYVHNSIMSHDQWIVMLASVFGMTLILDQRLGIYRQHEANIVGWQAPKPKFSRLAHWLENRCQNYRLCWKASLWRARTLEEIAPRFGPPLSLHALDAAAAYQRLSKNYLLRYALYKSNSILTRSRLCVLLSKSSAYSESSRFTYGRPAQIKDLILGVFLGPLLSRFGLPSKGGDPSCHVGARFK